MHRPYVDVYVLVYVLWVIMGIEEKVAFLVSMGRDIFQEFFHISLHTPLCILIYIYNNIYDWEEGERKSLFYKEKRRFFSFKNLRQSPN
jgi:hypothetical protein